MRGGTSSIGLEKCTHPPTNEQPHPLLHSNADARPRCSGSCSAFLRSKRGPRPGNSHLIYAAYNTGRPPTWEIQRRDRWSHCVAVRWILRDPAFLCAETATLPQSLRHSGHDQSSGSISGTATEVYLSTYYTYTFRKVRVNIFNSYFQWFYSYF